MHKRIVLHIDVNSAYLSWQTAYLLQRGGSVDYREIPAIVGGNKEQRRGIVLAKSIPAKRVGIQTGEALHTALQKCPTLAVLPTNYDLYVKSSKMLRKVISEYTPEVQQFSIDEYFGEFTGTHRMLGDPVKVAHEIRERIKKELGYTVSIGVSTNKLLAKVGSEMKKPDAVTTLFPDEMASKMWPMDVGELFGVGRSTKPKLNNMGIFTIGDLAQYDPKFLRQRLGKYGMVIWNYANGLEQSLVDDDRIKMKGIGNSSTISYDVVDREDALLHLLSLTEMVCMRLRHAEKQCGLVSVSVRSHDLSRVSHQRKLFYSTDQTNEIFAEVTRLFDEVWDGIPIRSLGVRVSHLSPAEGRQLPIFQPEQSEKMRTLDMTIDDLRVRFGRSIIQRGSFANTGRLKPMKGGTQDNPDYPGMSFVL